MLRSILPVSQAPVLAMSVRALLSTTALCLLALASSAHAQLTLRGDYAAARGMTEVSALYARQSRTPVTVTPFSTNAGIEGVISGEIDVAASARSPVPTRPEEQELVFWPVAWDAVVFIVHPSNPVGDLSLAQVRDIFNGTLQNWSEVGGRDAPIDLYSVIGPYDGLESSMRELLFGNPGYMAKIKRLFLNQHQIEIGIQMDPDAIGMTTLGGLNQQRVKPLRIEGVAADAQTAGNGSYLLTVPLYLVYRADNAKADEIQRFAQFLRTPAAENVITGKRLALHRDDDDFVEMHAQRMATLWQHLGGQPVGNGAIRLAASNGSGPLDNGNGGQPAAAEQVGLQPAADSAPAALEPAAAIGADAPAAVGTFIPAGAAGALPGDGNEPAADCKKSLFGRKC